MQLLLSAVASVPATILLAQMLHCWRPPYRLFYTSVSIPLSWAIHINVAHLYQKRLCEWYSCRIIRMKVTVPVHSMCYDLASFRSRHAKVGSHVCKMPRWRRPCVLHKTVCKVPVKGALNWLWQCKLYVCMPWIDCCCWHRTRLKH